MTPPAGSSHKGLFSQDDYLAPPHIPTGQPPKDVLNTIWRKNDVFLDIGSYSIGSAVMVIWPVLLLAILLIWNDSGGPATPMLAWGFGIIVGIPTLIVVHSLTQPVPPPVRFNRQRREVCVPRDDGTHWIVPWEQVTAAATSVSSIGQHGKTTQGLLVVGFTNPDPNAKKEDREYSLGFSCGGGTTAMCLWECMRSYMEIGPEAVADNTHRLNPKKGILATYVKDIADAATRKGWPMALLWEGFFGLIVFNTLLIDLIERKKLSPPPDLTAPEVVEWSKSLPPEQWAKRSPELERAIAEREAELAATEPAIKA
jgi:hypothetical protein